MKKHIRHIAFVVLSVLAISLVESRVHADDSSVELGNIRIKAGDTIIMAALVDHATSRDFLKRLPMTIRMTRAGEREYYGRPDMPISVDGPKQASFGNGEFGYWAPGGYLAIFLDTTVGPPINDWIVIGKVTSDLAEIRRLGPSVEMTIEHRAP